MAPRALPRHRHRGASANGTCKQRRRFFTTRAGWMVDRGRGPARLSRSSRTRPKSAPPFSSSVRRRRRTGISARHLRCSAADRWGGSSGAQAEGGARREKARGSQTLTADMTRDRDAEMGNVERLARNGVRRVTKTQHESCEHLGTPHPSRSQLEPGSRRRQRTANQRSSRLRSQFIPARTPLHPTEDQAPACCNRSPASQRRWRTREPGPPEYSVLEPYLALVCRRCHTSRSLLCRRRRFSGRSLWF